MQTALANTFVKFINSFSFHREKQTVPDGVQVRVTPGFGPANMPRYLRKADHSSPNDLKIKLATDFKPCIMAQYPQEAHQVGHTFRQKILLPKLKEAIARHVKLEVDVDDAGMLLPGFFKEAFGGLITIEKLKYEDIINHLVITTWRRYDYVHDINTYLEQAHEKGNN
jgi:hypothetical protein